MLERIQRLGKAVPNFLETRKTIAKQTLSEIEGSIRGSPLILLELDFPPNPSTEFEMKRRKAIKENRRNFLNSSFPAIKSWSERRLIE